MLLYFGPELLMPAASAAAAIAGGALMFWRRLVAGVKRLFRRGPNTSRPHSRGADGSS